MDHGRSGVAIRLALLLVGLVFAPCGVGWAQLPPDDDSPPPAGQPQPDDTDEGPAPTPEGDAAEDEPSIDDAFDAIEEATEAVEEAGEDAAEEDADEATEEAAEAPPEKPAPGQGRRQIQVQVQGGKVQIQAQGGAFLQTSDENAEASFVQPDRDQLQLLSRARRLLSQERYSEAIRALSDILTGEKDGVLPQQGDETPRFLKAEVLRILSGLTPQGREAYELAYGGDAQRQLDQAVAAGDVAGLENVARQYFHTPAGYEAMRLLGQHHMDNNRPLAAALCFRRLAESPAAADRYDPRLSVELAACWLWAGMPEAAAQAVLDLKQRRPDARFSIAGAETTLADVRNAAEAASWLTRLVGASRGRAQDGDDWAMLRGDAARNAPSRGGRPLLSHRWRMWVADDESLLEHISTQRVEMEQAGETALPALHPLAVGNVVLMRTVDKLLAVDFRTGKRIWEVAAPQGESIEGRYDSNASSGQAPEQTQLVEALKRRLWSDVTFGTLSSDGEYVYSIEDLELGVSDANDQPFFRFNRRFRRGGGGDPPQAHNRLAAHELATEGKLKWSLGGPPGEDGLEEAGTFFLGAPLPLAGRLYALAESQQEIRVLAINPRNHQRRGQKLVEWSLPLANIEPNAMSNGERQMLGVTPSFADGVLVCPAALGVVAAVDLTTRSLLWGYSYAPARRPQTNAFMQFGTEDDQEKDRWIDASATLAEGRVLLTPPGSAELHCLDLLSGKALWKRSRDDGLYLGCVDSGTALVVGRQGARGFRLADGEPAWDLKFDSGAVASGRGFVHSGKYYLPLGTARVVVIDIATGRKVDESRSRLGQIPGNLICHHGAVISQGADYLACFHQTEGLQDQVAAALRANPEDAQALALDGEILLDQARLAEAAAQLRRSLAANGADPRTRDLLFDALLEGLRLDFAQHREDAAELEGLISRPEQWDQYLRVAADGFQSAADSLAAFDSYLRLAGLKLDPSALGPGGPGLSVRRDRWVQARLAGLRQAARPDEVERMDALLATRLEAATAKGTADEVRAFLRYFGSHPLADGARRQLLERLGEVESAIEIETLLRRLAESSDPDRAAPALARLADLLARRDRPATAASYYARLARDYSEVNCGDGRTGAQVVAELPADEGPGRFLPQSDPYPEGVVAVDRTDRGLNTLRGFTIELIVEDGDRRAPVSLEVDQQAQVLAGRDASGRVVWRALVGGDARQQNLLAFQGFGSIRARMHGHVLVASFGSQAVAIDTLSVDSQGLATVLWRTDRSAASSEINFFNGIQRMQMAVPWGGRPRMVVTDGAGQPLGVLGPLTDDYVCLPKGRTLEALDPLSGERLWVRQGVDPGSHFFGDREVVIVAPSDAGQAQVLRALDGAVLGECAVPAASERMATLGRNLVLWSTANGQTRLLLRDPWGARDLWSRAFALGAKAAFLGLEAVGVLEPEGQFTLLDLADGRPLVQAKLEREPSLSEIHLLATADRYILVANNPFQQDEGVLNVSPVPMVNDQAIVHGHVYGFDRATGEQVWSAKVENQGLIPDQPDHLPVLVFACSQGRRDAQNANSQVAVGVLLCLDKRTGRVLHQEEFPPTVAFNNYELEGRPDAPVVELRLPSATLNLTFTGESLPVGEATADEEAPTEAPQGEPANP
jgi:outer membrane protein assembly factor BamB